MNLKSKVDENVDIFRALPGEGCAAFACRRTDCFFASGFAREALRRKGRQKVRDTLEFRARLYYILGRFALHFLVFPLLLQCFLSPHL